MSECCRGQQSDHIKDREHNFGGIDTDIIEESLEVEHRFAPGSIGNCSNHEMIDTEVLGDLCDRGSFHLGHLCAEGRVQSTALVVGLEELVPSRHRSEDNFRLFTQDRGEFDVREPSANPVEEAIGRPISEILGGIEERDVPRLIDQETVRSQNSGVVVQNEFGYDDISDADGIVDTTRDPGEDHDTRFEVIECERRHHGSVHLPDPASGDHDVSGSECADRELVPSERDRLARGHPLAKHYQFTGKGAHDQDRLFHAP